MGVKIADDWESAGEDLEPAGLGQEESDLALFADVAAFLDGDAPAGPARVAGVRDDGERLLYAEQVNFLFGDPESGKTMLADATAAEALRDHRRVAIVDMDHNGLASTTSRLLMLGAPLASLRDPQLFRYVEPDDADHLTGAVRALVRWRVALVVVDSVGELLPLLGLSSNQPDDFTVAHARVLKPLARGGACVVAIDHLAKNSESRSAGPTGTNAKRRAVGGVSLRVTATQTFTPGRGGRALVTINKDRHGGVRAICPAPEKGEAIAGTFVLDANELGTTWRIVAPHGDAKGEQRGPIDVEALAALDPPPTSVDDVKARMRWGSARATAALKAWRARSSSAHSPLPPLGVGNGEREDDELRSPFPTLGWGTRSGASACATCGEAMIDLGDGATTHPGCEVS